MLKATVIAALLVATTGCWGNLSNEDLIFLAGVPKAKEVELTVESDQANPNALTYDAIGDTARVYTDAERTATEINSGVGELLAMIENLGKTYPPTDRTEDARIWGPIAHLDGRTLRVEIRREDLDEGRPRFHYCIQIGRDEDISGEANRCGEPDRNGFRTVIGGFFDPQGEDGGARSGSGELKLDADAMRDLGLGDGETRGVLTLVYDFSRGGEAKSIAVDMVVDLTTNSTPRTLAYRYNRDLDGHVDYYFELDNVPPDPDDPGPHARSWQIDAVWDEGGPGRGEARGEGGDLLADEYLIRTECWDEDHKITYESWAGWQTGGSSPVWLWKLPLGGDPELLCP